MYTVLTGKIKDYSWPDSDITITRPDGTTVSESMSLYGEDCEGHRGSDVFPFGLLDSDTDDFEVLTTSRRITSTKQILGRFRVVASRPIVTTKQLGLIRVLLDKCARSRRGLWSLMSIGQ